MAGTRGEDLHRRLQHIMPYGSSTCSKAARLLPEEPAVVERASGCRVWDVEGREFIDFRNGLGPVTLGYCYPAVDEAVRGQLARGIVFSHPHRLECEVAELICEVVPCAEQARFLKTGGEAVAACLRLARAYTGREHVIQIGYNGWLNSLAAGGPFRPGRISEGVPAGVPGGLASVHHSVSWNDAAAVKALFETVPQGVAAVCVSAAYADMAAGETFYPELRRMCDAYGALLVFDEIVTGFRIALGGVQEYFGVVPDLAVFAKGMANGMPLSVYCGRRDVMAMCDVGGKTSISSTYGGESLSLAAVKAVIGVYRDQDVVGFLWQQGKRMWGGLNALLETYTLPVRLRGFWPCPQFVPEPEASVGLVQDLFRAAFRHGVILYNTAYVNFSHADADVDEALELMARALQDV